MFSTISDTPPRHFSTSDYWVVTNETPTPRTIHLTVNGFFIVKALFNREGAMLDVYKYLLKKHKVSKSDISYVLSGSGLPSLI